MSITTKNGSTFQEEVGFRPVTRPELETKFSVLTLPLLGKDRSDELRTLLLNIEKAPSVRPLMQALRFSAFA